MKTIALVIVTIFFSISIFSQEKNNHEVLGMEKTVYLKTAKGKNVKILNHYNGDNLLTERVLYVDDNGYWQLVKKTILDYDIDNRVKNIFYIGWDKEESKWKDQINLQSYYYDEKGDYQISHTRESKSKMKKLLTVKLD